MFFFSDRVVPESIRRKIAVRYIEIERNPDYGKEQVRDLIYNGVDNRIFQFTSYDPSEKVAQRVQIQTIVNNRLQKQMNCRAMYWRDSVWMAVDGEIREFSVDSAGSQRESLSQFDTLRLSEIPEQPERFEKSEMVTKGTDKHLGYNMSLDDIRRIIQYHKLAKRETSREEVYYHVKFALPLASFIIVLLAVPLASDPRRGSLAIGFAFSAGISFIYILLFETGQKLGTEGTLHPVIAAWGVNVLFFLVGLALLIKARK
jgi:lipopolysaccharide export system permease protein